MSGNSPALTRIVIYPIKSLDGLELTQASLLPTGPIENDRRWAIVDPARRLVNGKRTALVHSIRAHFSGDAARVTFAHERLETTSYQLPDEARGAAEWLSEALGRRCLLIENAVIGFPDDANAAGPTLVGVASLRRVAEWFNMPLDEVRRRIRANLEIDAVEPFWEDRLVATGVGAPCFTVGAVALRGRTACQRCVVPTRDSLTGEASVGWAHEFARRRQAELPLWAPAEAFDHYYRLTLNTTLDPTTTGTIMRLGDAVTVTPS